eukprot:Sspe_Gene.7848::Locus_2661_Transcript_1_1_Confidence_1.000_Length_974::g.7848::m.7848
MSLNSISLVRNFTLTNNADDPATSTFQRHREVKGWWVCPRNPLTDGFQVNWAPFFDCQSRRLGEAPGRWIWGSAYAGAAFGLMRSLLEGNMFVHLPRPTLPNQARWGHGWAQRRLFFLRITRPALIGFAMASAFWVPRELFCQNFNRRNRRNHFDFLPTVIGSACAYPMAVACFGRAFTWGMFKIAFPGFFIWEMFYSLGWTWSQWQREMHYPLQLAHHYGLPNGGKGWDQIDGGDHATEYRLESAVQSPFLQHTLRKIRNPAMMDHFPQLKYEWGHFSHLG